MANEGPISIVEYEALTTGVGWLDLTGRTLIEFTGRDRAAFLHGLCTNEIKLLTPGSGCEVFITNLQGKTIGHGYVYCAAESLLIDTVPDQAAALLPHFDRFLFREDVQLHDRTSERGTLLVAGQQLAERLPSLVTTTSPRTPWSHEVRTIAGHSVRVVQSGLLRVPSLSLIGSRSDLKDVSAFLTQHVAVNCSASALEAVRIESGTPKFGCDVTPSNLPQELNRDDLTISFKKGCYLGQETVARIHALGHVNRKLIGLRFDGDAVPPAGTELVVGEKNVGQVTSTSFSPTLGSAIGLAMVRRENSAPGTILMAAGQTGTVVAFPMVS